VAIMAALLLVAAVAGWSQAQYVEDVVHPGGLTHLRVASPQLVQIDDSYWVRPAGRFQFLTGPSVSTGGNPTRSGDEDRAICSQEYISTNDFLAYTSRIQFSIDQTSTVTDVEGKQVDIHELMEAADTADTPGGVENYWISPLVAGSRDVQGIARIPLDADTASEATQFVEVYHRFTMIYDILMVELIITNTSDTAHLVGTRIVFDGGFGGADVYDGQPVFFPDGSMRETEWVFPDPLAPSTGMPESWVTYDSLTNPLVAIRGLVDTAEVHDPSLATETAGLPDAIEFGTYSHIISSWFDYTANTSAAVTGEDWAYAVKWDEESLAPGQSRRYVTCFGVGAASADYEPPIGMGGYGPYKLVQQTGDDPATPDVTENYYLADDQGRSPFPVAVYVDNFSPSSLLNATATIDLPEGLELWPSSQSRTQSLGLVGRNELAGATWTLRASGARPGLVEVEFTGPQGKRVSRNIFIPALPVLPPETSPTGLEMISIPYQFTNDDAEHVFASLGSLIPGGSSALIRWETDDAKYRWFPDPFVIRVAPGLGYWLLNQAATVIELPADASPIPLTEQVSVNLDRGWNQIGCPFTTTVRFDQLKVVGPYGHEWSMSEAIARDLLQPALFNFNPQSGEYEWQSGLTQMRLDPYVGYWLLVKDDITLTFPPPMALVPTQHNAAAELAGLSEADDENSWQVQVVASAAGLRPKKCTFGASPQAAAGFDHTDIPSPPAALTEGPRLHAQFVNPSQQQPPCLVDMRPASQAENTWQLMVTTNAQQRDVTLSWPDLSALPGSLTAVLKDTASGQCRYMRTTSSYHYNSGVSGYRVFEITIQPNDSQGSVISQIHAEAAPGGNWTISYALSAPASVDIRIRNISGVVVKELQSGQMASAGTNSVLWSGRSDQGTVVPAGQYLCEITARSPNTGQMTKAIRSLVVTR